ncbi:MAG: hypothetical protein KC636_05960 [Myxococcales bacterium]|nr:hypothetical protein [Myxococcales bacterium]
MLTLDPRLVALRPQRVTPLGEWLARLEPGAPRPAPVELELILRGDEDLSRLHPEAKRREAVRYNFERLRERLLASHARYLAAPSLEDDALQTLAGWVELVVAHHCAPTRLYTNGQALASAVARDPGPVTVALHPRPDDWHAFGSPYYTGMFLETDTLAAFATLEAAEVYVRGALSRRTSLALPLRRGDALGTLHLWPIGRWPTDDGVIERYAARGPEGPGFVIERTPDVDLYTALHRVAARLDGFTVRTCATCSQFRFTGMSRGMSGGRSGYCERRRSAARALELPRAGVETRPSLRVVVGVTDSCDGHDFIEDHARPLPYIHDASR